MRVILEICFPCAQRQQDWSSSGRRSERGRVGDLGRDGTGDTPANSVPLSAGVPMPQCPSTRDCPCAFPQFLGSSSPPSPRPVPQVSPGQHRDVPCAGHPWPPLGRPARKAGAGCRPLCCRAAAELSLRCQCVLFVSIHHPHADANPLSGLFP